MIIELVKTYKSQADHRHRLSTERHKGRDVVEVLH